MEQPPTVRLAKEKRVKSFREVSLGYPKKIALEEARRCPQCTEPPCLPGCPLEIDIPEFIRLLREIKVMEALDKILEHNALPGICGRVCSAPCEPACVFHEDGSSIGIRALERFAADNGRRRLMKPKATKRSGPRVAIIGSGPAGLSAAAALARKDYRVTIFEALPLAGGVLRYGIPEFRLPAKVLDEELDSIRDEGVEIRTNQVIGRTVTVAGLKEQGFAAILLALGAGRPAFSDLPGADLKGVVYVQEFLIRSNLMNHAGDTDLGRKIVILGDTHAAVDAARIASRRDKEVVLVVPGMEEDLPLSAVELEELKEEGVRLESLAAPIRIQDNGTGAVAGIECQRLDFADPDGSGEWRLLPVPDAKVDVEADTVVLAAQKPSLVAIPDLGDLKLNPDGTVWVDAVTGETSAPGIFAAGDLVTGAGRIVDAMASGKRAASRLMTCLKSQSTTS